MSEYCRRKAIRMKVSIEEAFSILGVQGDDYDFWYIMDCLEGTEFEVAPTRKFFIDYNLPCSNDAEGDWGRTRQLSNAEYIKYSSKFSKLLKGRIVMPNELRLVEYCWYDCSEAPDYFDKSWGYYPTINTDFYDEV